MSAHSVIFDAWMKWNKTIGNGSLSFRYLLLTVIFELQDKRKNTIVLRDWLWSTRWNFFFFFSFFGLLCFHCSPCPLWTTACCCYQRQKQNLGTLVPWIWKENEERRSLQKWNQNQKWGGFWFKMIAHFSPLIGVILKTPIKTTKKET